MIINELNSYLVILIYGSLIMLAFLLIANPLRVNRKANFWCGVCLFLWSTFWLEEILILTNTNLPGAWTYIALRFSQFFTPIVFYFSVVYYTNNDYKFKKIDYLYLLLPFIFLIALILQQVIEESSFVQSILAVFIIIPSFYFSLISYIKIKNHKNKIQLFASNTREIDLRWLELIIITVLVVIVFIGVNNIISSAEYLNSYANAIFIVFVSFIGYNIIKQKEIYLLDEGQRTLVIESDQESMTAKRKVISDDELEKLKSELRQLMENQEPFLDAELRLIHLAELIKITPHQLSYVINEGFNENFFLFVNKYRVEKAKELLSNKEKNNLSIIGIAYESGFNSKTSFNTIFKKLCSQTPSQFKKSGSSL